VVFPDGYPGDLSTEFKVLGQLRLISTVVHVLHEDTSLIRVVVCTCTGLARVFIGGNFALFFFAYSKT